MRVLFIQRGPFASQALMCLSSFLKKRGHTIDVIVTAMEKDWLRAAVEFRPDVVGLPCITGEHTFMLSVADRIQEQYPEALVVLGGPHPTFCPEVIEHPSVDVIVRGEGEYALAELLERLERGEDLFTVRNLSIKTREGRTIHNPLRPLEQVLDAFPWPDRHLYDKYGGLQQRTVYWTMTTRGCPYNCSFCYSPALKALYGEENAAGKYVRRKSPSNVIGELKAVKVLWGIRHVDFHDNIFTLYTQEFLVPFLERYKGEIALPFSCQTRADLVTESLISRLKDAGCKSVAIGIEAGNDKINNGILAKGITREQTVAAGEMIHKYGLRLQTLCMLGSPGENLETALETLKLNQLIRADFARASLTQPYPMTPLKDFCATHGLLEEGFHIDNIENSIFVDTPILFQDKTGILRLQKVFGLCVEWPAMMPLMRRLVRMRGGGKVLDFFYLLFNAHQAYSIYTFYNYKPLEFLKMVLRAKGSYLTPKNKKGRKGHEKI